MRFYTKGGVLDEDSEDRDHLVPSTRSEDPTSKQSPQTSPLTDRLKHCRSPSDVLDLTCLYSPTNRQVSNCLSQMWTCTKKMADEQRRYELRLMFEHHGFELLLQRAMNSVGLISTADMAYSLLSMVNLGVPQRSRVVQTYLRACQEKLNEFDERSLSILSTCLENMDESPNASALKDGMRVIVEIRLHDIKNVISLQTMIRLLGKDAPMELKRKLEAKALSMADQFSLPNSMHMINIMAKINFYSKPLLEVCSKNIRDDLNGIPFNRLFRVLLSCKELHFRDFDLFKDVSDSVAAVADIWTTKQILLFLFIFEGLNFCPDSLMEVVAEKVIADPDALTLKDLLCALKAFSSLNYDLGHRRQQFLDGLCQALESYLPKMSKWELLRMFQSLCLLGHLPSAPLERLLHESMLEQFKTTPPKLLPGQSKSLRMVDLCLRLEPPPLTPPPAIPSSLLEHFTPLCDDPNALLSQCLQEMLGDLAAEALQEQVVVENFYFIDAVITKPQPHQTPEAEKSPPAGSSQRVAVFCASPSAFCFGTKRPRGTLAAKIRHLRILGYEPVVVSPQELHSLPLEKRTEFLREQIFPEHHKSTAEQLGA